MTQPFTAADVELVAETVAADLGLEAWQVRRAARAALRALAAAGRRTSGPLLGVLVNGQMYHPADVEFAYLGLPVPGEEER